MRILPKSACDKKKEGKNCVFWAGFQDNLNYFPMLVSFEALAAGFFLQIEILRGFFLRGGRAVLYGGATQQQHSSWRSVSMQRAQRTATEEVLLALGGWNSGVLVSSETKLNRMKMRICRDKLVSPPRRDGGADASLSAFSEATVSLLPTPTTILSALHE